MNDELNTDKGINIQSTGRKVTRMAGIAGGDKPRVEIHAVRGSFEDPKSLEPGDYGVSLNFTTAHEENNTDISKSLVSLLSRMDSTASKDDIAPKSSLSVLVGAGDGNGDVLDSYMGWRFNNNGSFETKIVQYIAQSKSMIESIQPKNGMIIYNEDTHKFQGFANGAWVDLHM